MRIKEARHLLLISTFFICFGTVFGQTEPGAFAFAGKIKLEIRAKDNGNEKYFRDVPVNGQRLKFRWSDSLRSEFSETNKVTQLNWHAVEDEKNIRRAFLTLTLMVSDDNGKTKTVRKKIKILKGETRSFRLKNKNTYYEIDAFYEPENK